mmetsp:Transcript_22769/g.35686  ORF Transcript_22769/g.35686 Transcript_22769/m.35686 type:complete len:86 (+) Transcript_22769:611-868(+)
MVSSSSSSLSSGMKSPSLEFRNGVLFWRKLIIPIICREELAVVDAVPPRLTGNDMKKAWLADGNNAKRSSFISSGSGCIIDIMVV